MRSNSARRRMRFAAVRPRPSTAAEGASLPFVGDSQALPPFGPTSLQDNPAIFRRHAYPKAMRFLAAAGVGLVGALPLHRVLVSVFRRIPPAKAGASRVWRTVNTSRRGKGVSTQDRRCDVVLQSPFPICTLQSSFCFNPSVCSPRFPQLWKTLWKTPKRAEPTSGSANSGVFQLGQRRAPSGFRPHCA